MKRFLSKVSSWLLSIAMIVTIIPSSAYAGVVSNYNSDYQSTTHSVFKHTEQTLAPGVTEYTNYAYTTSDNQQMVYYVTTADLTRDDVVAQVAYKDMQDQEYGMDKLSNMVACANEKYSDPTNEQYISENYTVVSACNGDGYNMTTGEPSGVFIMGGVIKKDWTYSSSSSAFLAIKTDGTAYIGNTADEWSQCKTEGVEEAIDAFGSILVWDGEVKVSATGSYYSDRASRTMVGITADGKLVTCVVDGRQEPFSCGASMAELAQIMLEAGCVRAFNLDGGGSTTFMAKNEGSDDCTIINRPSDGSERSISNGIIIASTAVPSDTFDHVNMTADDEYLSVGSSESITVAGVTATGTAADIPEGITYEVTNGTYENGIVTATAVGDVVITAKLDGAEVGSLTLKCVVPDSIEFSSSTYTIPYGKTATLEMVTKYGLNEVITNADNYTFTLENAAAGTLDGFAFTAGDDATITSCGITAKYNGTDLTASATLVFGKGSEIVTDFEDDNANGADEADLDGFDWMYYDSYNYYLPNTTIEAASVEDGAKVHSGNQSMRLSIDYSNSEESGYQMAAMVYTGAQKIYPGATKLGVWMYIPDEYVGLWVRWLARPITATTQNDDGTTSYSLGLITSNTMDQTAGGTGVVYSFQESGWHYLSVDLSSYQGVALLSNNYVLQFYISDRDGSAYNYYAQNVTDINGKFTLYLDDVTVDYSSVVDDREAPIFSGETYATYGMSDAQSVTDGMTINNNTVDFAAAVAENTSNANATGLDASTAKAHVDGNEVACKYSNGTISLANSAVLTNGQHEIKFSICDKQGNYASIIRKVNITGGNDATVKVVAHDSSLDRILFGSLYYVDVVTTDAASTNTVDTTLNLDSMNTWELDHMQVADGYSMTYDYNDDDRILTLHITKDDGTALTGEQTLVSIPVRVWELNNVGSQIGGTWTYLEEGNKYTYSFFKNGNEYWRVSVDVRIQQGLVNGTETFTGEDVFCDTESWAIQKFMVTTAEGKAYKAAWDGGHIHTAEAVEDVAATCTEAGYTGRTFCAVCNSIVDWGTTVPATGHSYELVEGQFVCSVCGDVYAAGTGMFEMNGKSYYAINDKVVSGWYEIDNAWYYFMPDTCEAADGDVTTTDGVTFNFVSGKVTSCVWVANENGSLRYWYGPSYYKLTSYNVSYLVQTIDGNTYLFDKDGYVQKDKVVMTHRSNETTRIWYSCDENGVATLLAGPMLYEYKGSTYYVDENGESPYLGVIQYDGDIYYVNSAGKIKTGDAYITKNETNGLIEAGWHNFGTDGKLTTVMNGIDIDGYYRVDGVIQKSAGLVSVDGSYYFINKSGKYQTGINFLNSTETNGIFVSGWYNFGTDGKLVIIEKGIDSEGYYYENNAIQKSAGLVEVDGSYYYVNKTGKYQTGVNYLNNGETHGILGADWYDFGTDGKITIASDGIDAYGYYRVDGAIQKNAGLVLVDGSYYYINKTGKYKAGVNYLNNAETNGILPAGWYNFGTDGKLILVFNGIDAEGYYRVDGVIQKNAGLVLVDGSYYYINKTGKYKTGVNYLNKTETNGILPAGWYDFGTDGKLILE